MKKIIYISLLLFLFAPFNYFSQNASFDLDDPKISNFGNNLLLAGVKDRQLECIILSTELKEIKRHSFPVKKTKYVQIYPSVNGKLVVARKDEFVHVGMAVFIPFDGNDIKTVEFNDEKEFKSVTSEKPKCIRNVPYDQIKKILPEERDDIVKKIEEDKIVIITLEKLPFTSKYIHNNSPNYASFLNIFDPIKQSNQAFRINLSDTIKRAFASYVEINKIDKRIYIAGNYYEMDKFSQDGKLYCFDRMHGIFLNEYDYDGKLLRTFNEAFEKVVPEDMKLVPDDFLFMKISKLIKLPNGDFRFIGENMLSHVKFDPEKYKPSGFRTLYTSFGFTQYNIDAALTKSNKKYFPIKTQLAFNSLMTKRIFKDGGIDLYQPGDNLKIMANETYPKSKYFLCASDDLNKFIYRVDERYFFVTMNGDNEPTITMMDDLKEISNLFKYSIPYFVNIENDKSCVILDPNKKTPEVKVLKY